MPNIQRFTHLIWCYPYFVPKISFKSLILVIYFSEVSVSAVSSVWGFYSSILEVVIVQLSFNDKVGNFSFVWTQYLSWSIVNKWYSKQRIISTWTWVTKVKTNCTFQNFEWYCIASFGCIVFNSCWRSSCFIKVDLRQSIRC